jgi:hypothetical protein
MSNASDVLGLLEQLTAKGWTTAAIADAIGAPRTTVARWRMGMHRPAHAQAVALALEQLLARKRIPKRKRYGVKEARRSAKSPDEEGAQHGDEGGD